MRVWLDNSVLVPAWQPEVSAILALGHIGRHRVLPMDDAGYSTWVEQFDGAHSAMYRWVRDESTSREAAGGATHEILVVSVVLREEAPTVPRLSPRKSLELLLQPFRLVLENARNDWRFIRRMATASQRKHLEELFDKGWLVTTGGGRGELTKEVERVCRGLEGEKLAAAFFDSDSTEPGKVSHNTELAMKVCENARLLYQCLARRAIENYLPLESLRLWACQGSKADCAERRRRVAALVELKKRDSGRRDCFPMKKGFKTLPPDMEGSEWTPLKAGFGDDIAELRHTLPRKAAEGRVAAIAKMRELANDPPSPGPRLKAGRSVLRDNQVGFELRHDANRDVGLPGKLATAQSGHCGDPTKRREH